MDFLKLITAEARRRNLSQRTIETYCFCVANFFKRVNKEPKKVTKNDVKWFLDYLINKKVASNTLNVYLNAIKFFFTGVLNKKLVLNMKFAKTPKRLPQVLTKKEVLKLIGAITNSKHKLMVEVLYSSGLRLSELINLRVEHLNLEQNLGWVRKGKGRKDRLFIVSRKVKVKLESWVKDDGYVFCGRKGRKLHPRTVQEVVKTAGRKAGIKKNVHPHMLRHSFATHLIENGYDVNSVQSLLGHSSAKTTMVYIHMASPLLINVKSPYD